MRTLEDIEAEQRLLQENYTRLAREASRLHAQQLHEQLSPDWPNRVLAAVETAIQDLPGNFGRGFSRAELGAALSVTITVEVTNGKGPLESF